MSSKIDAIISSIRNVTWAFPLSRGVLSTNRRKEAKLIVSGTIENNNHADTWYFGPNFVMVYL